MRDQLWAEAAVREAEGEAIELPRELWRLANAEQEQRRLIHPIETRLNELLDGVEVGFIPNKEIRRALNLKVDRMETRQQKLADETMQRLGWQRVKEALKVGPRFRERGWAKGESYRASIFTYQGDPSDPENGKFVAATPEEVSRRTEADHAPSDF